MYKLQIKETFGSTFVSSTIFESLNLTDFELWQ